MNTFDISDDDFEVTIREASEDYPGRENSEAHGGSRPGGKNLPLLQRYKAGVLEEITRCFCQRFLNNDPMSEGFLSAARNAHQKLVESCKYEGGINPATGAATSDSQPLIVARGNLQILLQQYTSFLRSHQLPTWEKDSREALYIRELGKKTPTSYELFKPLVESRPMGVVGNIAISLIRQTTYLLDQFTRRKPAAVSSPAPNPPF